LPRSTTIFVFIPFFLRENIIGLQELRSEKSITPTPSSAESMPAVKLNDRARRR